MNTENSDCKRVFGDILESVPLDPTERRYKYHVGLCWFLALAKDRALNPYTATHHHYSYHYRYQKL